MAICLFDTGIFDTGVFDHCADVGVKKQEGGAPGRAKKRRRYEVEIDGQTFRVSSVQEAEELLAQAEQVAQEQAQKAVEKSANAPKRQRRKIVADARKALSMPQVRVVGSDVDPVAAAIEQQARAFAERIQALYREALQAVEIGALLRRRQIEEEDEEIAMLLVTL